jgi:hypothetical protein
MLMTRRAYSKDGSFRDTSFSKLDLGADRDTIATFYGTYAPADLVDHSIADTEVELQYVPSDIQLSAEFAKADAVRPEVP